MLGLEHSGGERGPVTSPAFKAGDRALREPYGGFDSHTLPPTFLAPAQGISRQGASTLPVLNRGL